MKPPKTAALWTQLERLGWRHDSLPVATIMKNYEAMELDLVAAKEQIANRNKRLAKMSEELDQARQDARQSDLDAIRALGERNDARKELDAERTLADGLAKSAQELVDRWETQFWKDVPHTGKFIRSLDDAVDALKSARDGETDRPYNPIPSADEIDAHLDDLAAKSAREWKSLRDDPEVFYPRVDE